MYTVFIFCKVGSHTRTAVITCVADNPYFLSYSRGETPTLDPEIRYLEDKSTTKMTITKKTMHNDCRSDFAEI